MVAGHGLAHVVQGRAKHQSHLKAQHHILFLGLSQKICCSSVVMAHSTKHKLGSHCKHACLPQVPTRSCRPIRGHVRHRKLISTCSHSSPDAVEPASVANQQSSEPQAGVQAELLHPRDTSQHSPQLDVQALYTSLLYSPERHIADIAVSNIPGQGAALVARQDFRTGDLLMVVEPLAVAWGQQGQPPDVQTVVDVLAAPRAQIPASHKRWIQLLHRLGDGTPPYGISPEQRCQELQELLTGTWQAPSTDSEPGPVTVNTPSTNAQPAATPPLLEQVQPAVEAADAQALQADVAQGVIGVVIPSLSSSHLSELSEVVEANMLSEAQEDVAVSELRQQEPIQSYSGVWPEFSLLNHSCAPNTAHLVIGGYLILRAARPILDGQQLTTCYLAEQRFLHVAARRAVLKEQHGFHCCCDRCILEQALFPTARYTGDAGQAGIQQARRRRFGPAEVFSQWVLNRVFGQGRYMLGTSRQPDILRRVNKVLAEELQPGFQAALTAPRSAAVQRRQVVDRLLSLIEEVEAAMQALGLDSRDAVLLQASVYNMYRLVLDLVDLVPDILEPQAVVAVQDGASRVLDAVARGTDAHMYLAATASTRMTQLAGRDSVAARMEQLRTTNTYYARYGQVPVPLLQKLIEVRRKQTAAARMGQRLGVLAWDLTSST